MNLARTAAALLALAAWPGGAPELRAQADTTAVELARLRTPASPAFVLLGVSPTAVERPTTPRGFAFSVASAALESDGAVPGNYAAELAPYWLGSRRTLTFRQYYEPTLLQSLQQTFSLSFATNTVVENEDSLPAVGAGFRVAPFVGGPGRRLDSLVARLDTAQDGLLDLRIALRRARTAADSAALLARIAADSASAAALSSQVRGAMGDEERVGFRLQLAGGVAAYYPGNRFSAGKIGRTGVWATAAYRLERPAVDVVALARYLANEEGTEQEAVDVGGRAVLLFEPFSASFEWVSRSVSGGEGPGPDGRPGLASGARGVGMLEYRVRDGLFVSFSFGQDYPRAGEDGQPLVAVLGGQLHLGATPLVALP